MSTHGMTDDGDQDRELAELTARLFHMAREGSMELLAYVEAGVPATLTDPKGDTLVMLAAYHGHVDLVRGLVALGADVSVANDRGQTPLAGAVFKGEVDVVRALREAGADPDAGVPTARDTARMFQREDLLELLDAPRPEPEV